jgi:glycosyltransferase 2 family protein
LLATFWRREFRLWNYRFTIPDGRETMLQVVIGAIDLAFAGAALYLLLPDIGRPDLLTFLTIYAVAMVTGALSHSPGGLGVFEGVVLLLMPDAPKAGVLAALVLFRLIYTYIPFLLGLMVIAFQEWRALRASRAARRALPAPSPANNG